MSRGAVAAVVAGAAFLALGAYSFKSSLTPYVPFAEARKSRGVVQVAGALVKDSSRFAEEDGTLRFTLQESGGSDILDVAYTGPKPSNFEDAVSIVAIGRFDGEIFAARQLLVKCPSKYQGTQRSDSNGN
jgi:cytochrome c-type biogenesis protein CcmE